MRGMQGQAITVSKPELLDILQANRARHRKVFEAALEGYRKEGLRKLEANIRALREGKTPELRINVIRPEDHSRDYDRVIRMVTMHQGDTLVMDEGTFACYVEDDWDWKRQWLSTSNVYAAGTVKEFYEKEA